MSRQPDRMDGISEQDRLDSLLRAALTEHVRGAYLANLPDGPRSFACVAWGCRGTVPA